MFSPPSRSWLTMAVDRPLATLLFASAQPIYPAGWGGAETCAHDLLIALASRGVRVRALGAVGRGDSSRVRDRLALACVAQAEQPPFAYDVGYPCELVQEVDFAARLRTLIELDRPHLVLTQALGWPDAVDTAHGLGLPAALYVHGAEVHRIGRSRVPPDLVLYNSLYTREWLAGEFDYPGAILYPPTDLQRHRVTRPGPAGAITLVNPLPVKGGHLLPELARAMPDRAFLAVEGWTLPPFLERLLRRIPNIEVLHWQQDMRPVFARTAVLLAPSQFEPFGRTPVEAAASGIPCVSSGAGGLREAIGPQGIYVEPVDSLDAWVAALRRLEDPKVYDVHSAGAAQWASRFDAPRMAERFLALTERLVCTGGASEHG
jgi:glycosyltransferase involved in cell wall biosynthesis